MLTQESLLFLARLTEHLRNGGIFEVAGPSEGRVIWSATRFRLADRDGIELQIQVETQSRTGRTAIAPWTFSDWTAEHLASLYDDLQEDGINSTTLPATATPGDPVLDEVLKLAQEGRAVLAGKIHLMDDDGLSIDDRGQLVALNTVHHRADDWITLHLTEQQIQAIQNNSQAIPKSRESA